MKYFIQVDKDDVIKDIITYAHENYVEINIDFSDYNYPIHCGVYKFIDNNIELCELLELEYLKELQESEVDKND